MTNATIIEIASELGFDLVGFAKVEELKKETEKLALWLESGYQAGMKYMERNPDKRRDVKLILPSAKSVISLGMNYYTNNFHSHKKGYGKISRYAWGKDYHLIIGERLEKFISKMKEISPGIEAVYYVDTGPVMDKVWAARAGLGWLGKHTNIINKEIGSWFFIANIFINIEFEYNTPITDHCGTCTACIDACPTDAIVNEYVVDANKCISYLTIENKGDVSGEFLGKFENFLFGCDICQDVCPWNGKFSQITSIDEFSPYNNETEIELGKVIKLDNHQFKIRFKDSPVLRSKLKGLKRNAKFLYHLEDK
jgi:epoxyqueuosine reductase